MGKWQNIFLSMHFMSNNVLLLKSRLGVVLKTINS